MTESDCQRVSFKMESPAPFVNKEVPDLLPEKSILPINTVLLGTFAATVVADLFFTFWAVHNGYIESNPLAAPLVNNDFMLWAAVRLFGTGLFCYIFMRLSMFQSTATKAGSLFASSIAALWGVTQFAGNLNALGVT